MFKLDLRSIAFFRQCLAMVGLTDLLLRGRFVAEFYSDLGMLPRTFAVNMTEKWSFHFTSDSVYFQSALFLIHGLFFFLLWMGWKPKLSSFFAWIFTLSMHARNDVFNDGGDSLFRHMLFWSMLLPSEAHFRTLAFENVRRATYRFSNLSTIGLIWLAVSLYTFSGWSKLISPLWIGKAGVMNGLWAEWYVSALGQRLRLFSVPFLQFLNDWTLYMELLWVWLLFIPDELEATGKKTNLSLMIIRLAVIGGFVGLHVGILFFLALGTFPWFCLVLWTAFIPSQLWDRIPIIRWMRKILPAPVSFDHVTPGLSLPQKGFVWFSATASENYTRATDFLQQGLGFTAIILGILWNSAMVSAPKFPNPNWSRVMSVQLGLEQGWNLFIRPEGVLSWLSVIGKFQDGEVKEIGYLKDLPSIREKPPLLSALYPSYRWREIDYRYMWGHYDQLRMPLSNYICSSTPGLRSFMITQYLQVVESQIDGKVRALAERPRGEYSCFIGLLDQDRASILAFKKNQK